MPVLVSACKGRHVICRPADARLAVKFRLEKTDLHTEPSPGSPLLITPLYQVSRKLWHARVSKIPENDSSVGMHERIVKINHNVPSDFPQTALAEARTCAEAALADDICGREDLRQMPFVTIDGDNARDFDDAIYVEKTGSGWILRVCIADVSHFVRPQPGKKCSLDAEAKARGNSWYFPTTVEPMLPFAISNDACSLMPGKDRLAILAELSFANDGSLMKTRFAPSVIRSHARLTYAQAQRIHDGSAQCLTCCGDNLADILSPAFGLFDILRQKRLDRGTLDFNLPESEYVFDDSGNLADMSMAVRTDAHRLIEEFMIQANEAVARYLENTGIQFLYRVHPAPQQLELQKLLESLESVDPALFYPGWTAESDQPGEVMRAILARARGSAGESAINRLCLRAMPQARYQPHNEGHFGLASGAYCHFTSPIRRYADILVHRALKAAIGIPCGQIPAGEKLVQIADQLNHMEREAADCEREMNRRLGCLFLTGKTGKKFSGTISGIMPFGIFVLLDEIPVEGLIKIGDLRDDFYNYDRSRQILVGRKYGKTYHMGQELTAKLRYVDMIRLDARLEITNENFAGKPPARQKSLRTRNGHARRGPGAKMAGKKRKAAR